MVQNGWGGNNMVLFLTDDVFLSAALSLRTWWQATNRF
jgi:hypothetical protein